MDISRHNHLLVQVQSLLHQGQIFRGEGLISDDEPIPVDEIPKLQAVLEESGDWSMLLRGLKKLSIRLPPLWGEDAIPMLADWSSQVSSLILYEYSRSDWRDVVGLTRPDMKGGKIVELAYRVDISGVKDEYSFPRCAETDLAATLLHELFHVAEELHTSLDLSELNKIYEGYCKRNSNLLIYDDIDPELVELLPWLIEQLSFGHELVGASSWRDMFPRLLEWAMKNHDSIWIPFPTKKLCWNRNRRHTDKEPY